VNLLINLISNLVELLYHNNLLVFNAAGFFSDLQSFSIKLPVYLNLIALGQFKFPIWPLAVDVFYINFKFNPLPHLSFSQLRVI
jgi:hypothetical protein